MGKFTIKEYDFSNNGKEILGKEPKSVDWPVVYLLHNNKELYVGETQSVKKRIEQHLKNPDRKKLKLINVIYDEEFNKSAILDIEQSLIQLFNADNKYVLQNLNGGQSQKHNYYQREKYLNKLDLIWEELKKHGMTNASIEDIRNSDLFKYSPYNTLTSEQHEVCKLIIYDMMDKLSQGIDGTSILSGGAGTGKTICLINMIYKLVNANKFEIDFSLEDDELSDNTQMIHDLKDFLTRYNKELTIGYVVPMTSIRKTLQKVFKLTKNGLKQEMVIGPFDIFKKEYDVLFVDEAHRLARYNNIGFRGVYKKKAELLGKTPQEITQLDMIMAKSKYRVLVYDKNQTVKGSDVTSESFEESLKKSMVSRYNLTTQMRCKGGSLYTDYIDSIFSCSQIDYQDVENYDLKIFDDVNDMVNKIKDLDKIHGLCRNASGYSWEWISKEIANYDEVIKQNKQDITIGNYKYVWNMNNEEFILSENSINEIGCIHTLQGYDLNYIGIIFGREIDYDPIKNKITIDRNLFFDTYVKLGASDEVLKNFIINSYKVIMTRGIKGCYIYCYNKNMKDYLRRFIK